MCELQIMQKILLDYFQFMVMFVKVYAIYRYVSNITFGFLGSNYPRGLTRLTKRQIK